MSFCDVPEWRTIFAVVYLKELGNRYIVFCVLDHGLLFTVVLQEVNK